MKLFNVLLRKELVTQLFGDTRGMKKDVLGKIISALISLLFLALFVFLFVAFHSKFTALNLVNEVLIIFLALGILAQIIFSVGRTGNVLYGGADAKVILPLPISNLTMLTAKLFALWIKELVNSCFFLAPVLIAYGIMAKLGPLYYVFAVVSLAIASLFTVSISALLAPAFVKIKKFFGKHSILVLILSLLFFVALFIAYSRVLEVVSEMLLGDTLRFIFNQSVARTLQNVSKYLFFAAQIGDFLSGGIKGLIGFAIIFVTTSITCVLAYFISSYFYLSFLKSNTQRHGRRVRARANKRRSVKGALRFKERTEVFKNPTYMFSYLSVVLTLPALSYLTVGILSELISKLLGGDFVVPFAILIVVMFSCVCNTSAGDVISREENRIMIVKTIPVSYRKQVGSKVRLAMIIALISDVLTVLALSNMIGIIESVLLLAITVLATFASIMHLVARDINNPQVNANGGENSNVSSAVIRALVVSLILGVLCFALHGAEVFLADTGHAFIRGVAEFVISIGGIYGIMAIALGLCLIDFIIALLRMLCGLEKRMRRIKI